ncbi:MAG: HNH endonuclease [Thermoplasmatota archaeon]
MDPRNEQESLVCGARGQTPMTSPYERWRAQHWPRKSPEKTLPWSREQEERLREAAVEETRRRSIDPETKALPPSDGLPNRGDKLADLGPLHGTAPNPPPAVAHPAAPSDSSKARRVGSGTKDRPSFRLRVTATQFRSSDGKIMGEIRHPVPSDGYASTEETSRFLAEQTKKIQALTAKMREHNQRLTEIQRKRDPYWRKHETLYPGGSSSSSEWMETRRSVLARDCNRCVKCGRGATEGNPLHIDHIKPLSKHGSNRLRNLQTLCKECHERKHGRALDY